MITIIDTPSPSTIALRISGKIEKEDIERVIEAVEGKSEEAGKLGVYVELQSFGGISLEALVEDVRFAFPNMRKFSKKAVVSESGLLGRVIEAGDRFFPSIEVRHFSSEQKDEAMKWVGS